MEIKKGMRFRCIKDVVIKTVINPCAKEYIEGREYISMNDNAITNEWGDIRRKWTNKIENHFELTESKPMNYDLEKTVVHCTTPQEYEEVLRWHYIQGHRKDEKGMIMIMDGWSEFGTYTYFTLKNPFLIGNMNSLNTDNIILSFSQFERDFLNKEVVEQSVKNDFKDGKLRWDLLPLDLIEEVVKVYHAGAKKYGANRWQNLEDGESRYFSAMMRHIRASQIEDIDEDTGCYHYAQICWNALALLHFKLKVKEE